MIHLHRVLNYPLKPIDTQCNVNYFEGDVRCTGDGVLVMAHDAVWEGLPIDQSTFCLLNHFKPLPKLVDVLSVMKDTNIGVNLEIKADGMFFDHYQSYFLLNLLRLLDMYHTYQQHNHHRAPTPIVQCFNREVLLNFSYFCSFFPFTIDLSWLIEAPEVYVRALTEENSNFITYISPDYKLIQTSDIDIFHRLGFKVLPWTLPDLYVVLSNPEMIQADGWIIDYIC